MFDDNQSLDQDSDSQTDEDVTHDGKRKRDENSADGTKKKVKRLVKDQKDKELYRPPTTEELNHLRETENLYKSNLLRLEIDELLLEINVKETRAKQIEDWLESLRSIIDDIESKRDVCVDEIVPLPNSKKGKKKDKFLKLLCDNRVEDLKCDQNLTIKFQKPLGVNVFGAYQLGCVTRAYLHLNVNVTMPPSCFHEKDYLNNRYFLKRYYYLVYIFGELKQTPLTTETDIVFRNGIKLLPYIRITPPFGNKITMNVFVNGSEDCFKLQRFTPEKNNIKTSLFEDFYDVDVDAFSNTGTPFYNAILAKDLSLNLNYTYMETVLNLKNIQDGIKLLSVWLKQRELDMGLNSFTVDILFYVMTYLINQRRVNQHMSSYQVVRIFWTFLASTNWHEAPLSLCQNVKDETLELYKNSYDVSFLDKSGNFNVTSFLNLDVYLKIRNEAQLALKILDDDKFNSFTALFITRLPFAIQYDAVIKLHDANKFRSVYERIDNEKKWKNYGFYNDLIISEITSLLKQGLTQRITNIVPYVTEENTFDNESALIKFGVKLNPSYAFTVVEKGPLEDDPKSADFRQFWGSLSDCRRFVDGTICEAVYFESSTIQEKRQIFTRIINFVLKEKYNLCVEIVSDQFERVLKMDKVIAPFPVGTNEEPSLKVKAAFDGLNKTLRELKLPLIITSVHGVSDVFSYTDLFPPLPKNYHSGKKLTAEHNDSIILNLNTDARLIPRYTAPIHCVIQLGLSSNWPNDLEALRCMRTEFYFEISNLLQKHHSIKSKVKFQYLDVLYEGFVFRLKLYIPKEIMLAKKGVNSEGAITYKETEESNALEKELELMPKISSALNGIQQQYPSYGPSTALAKRWLRSQLIDESHISDVVVNLLNASFYLGSAPFETPNLPQVGFLRFLKFLIDTEWNLNPVVVNFNNDIEKTMLNELEINFQQQRASYPNLYIITPYDNGRSVFTKNTPTKLMLNRITVLATETFNYVHGCIMEWKQFLIRELFVPSLEGYNVLIHINPHVNPTKHMHVIPTGNHQITIQPYSKSATDKIPITDFNPVQIYLRELRETYEDIALFFHDSYGGNVIAVLWMKDIFCEKDFKITNTRAMKYVNNKLVLNREAILEDFYILGNGIVKNIEIL